MNGTDREIFGAKSLRRPRRAGRPRVNRELGYQLLKAGYSTQRIRRILKCSTRTVRLMRQEMKEQGLTDVEVDEERLEGIELKFDEECERAMGFSFYQWLKSKAVNYKPIFSFNRRVWTEIWKKPSLVLAKDRSHPLSDDLAISFSEVFGEDRKRIRRRKKLIRYIFRFLGREDICNRHLTMTRARDPVEVRELPEISFPDFPTKLERAISEIGARLGLEIATAIRLKIVTQMRTGSGEKELMGLRVGGNGGSYLIMNDPDNWRMKILGKANEEWTITWIPSTVRRDLYELCTERGDGEHLFNFDLTKVRRTWRKVTRKIVGKALSLHDMRKVSLTWLWAMGVPLEIATTMNVGWRDLNTARDFYLQYRRLLRREDRERYCQAIPDWFKEGLEEYA